MLDTGWQSVLDVVNVSVKPNGLILPTRRVKVRQRCISEPYSSSCEFTFVSIFSTEVVLLTFVLLGPHSSGMMRIPSGEEWKMT